MDSPYLWNNGYSSKPLVDEMMISHNGYSEMVIRALSDFGIEDTNNQAAKRFKEHYKFDISPSTISRTTKAIGKESEVYIEQKLATSAKESNESQASIEKILVEMDGCEIRTAEYSIDENSTERTPVYDNPKKIKDVTWKDVRIGFSRPIESKDDKIFVGKKDSFDEVNRQLYNASKLIGMGPETEVVGVSDGGIGLPESMKRQFPNMIFILDKTHLKDHLYETAEEQGIKKKDRPNWVNPRLDLISSGKVETVIMELEELYKNEGNDRVRRLIGYLNRFIDAVDYNYFKDKGLPIGSGEIESSHKYIPQKRLKVPGACWHPESINPILALRILRADDWWEDFWNERSSVKYAA